jgi:hypothetical protein
MPQKLAIHSFSELMSPPALELLSARGSDLVQQIGMDVVRGVVLNVLTGKNLRDSTEVLTRRRLVALNLETLNLFMRGSAASSDFISELPNLASNILSRKRLTKTERWLAQWMLGLTDKAFQNVLRDNPDAIIEYRDQYIAACNEIIIAHQVKYGTLNGEIVLDTNLKAQINWLWITYLLNAIGAQTLAIRGSEKSSYGKLFEKLVLGSLLHILGFKHIAPPPEEFEKVFWLSSQGEKRESDATLLYQPGKGVRFDIGFIGRGNPEISLDKVTRFEREISLGRSKYYMATVILVDRIGANSRIEQMAQEVQGTIIQMSAGYWPQRVATVLHESLGFKHKLVNMEYSKIEAYLADKIQTVSLEDFIGLSEEFKQNTIREDKAQYSFFDENDSN